MAMFATAFVVFTLMCGLGFAADVEDFDTIKLYTLKNDSGMTIKVTNYGAIITSIIVPDRDGKMATELRTGSSRSPARPTRSPRTTVRTTCTAASLVSTKLFGTRS